MTHKHLISLTLIFFLNIISLVAQHQSAIIQQISKKKEMALDYLQSEPDSAYFLAEEMFALSEKIMYNEGKALAKTIQGHFFMDKNEYKKALRFI